MTDTPAPTKPAMVTELESIASFIQNGYPQLAAKIRSAATMLRSLLYERESKPSSDDALREQAYKTVLEVRGSWDAPGFDACVNAEYNRLVDEAEREKVKPVEGGKPRWSDQYDADDMEEVGRSLIDTIHSNREALKGWAPANCPTEIVSDLINERDALRTGGESLYESIKHGDEDHKRWLREAIIAWFSGAEIPPVNGNGNKETKIDSLTAQLSAALQERDAARDKALEEAAQATIGLVQMLPVFEDTRINEAFDSYEQAVVDAIRALKTQSTPAHPDVQGKVTEDTRRLDWLQEQTVDTIYLDDGRIIDVRGGDLRAALTAALEG